MQRQQLIQRIRDTAYLEGEFTLRSGKKSSYYIDKYRFETRPDILKALAAAFAEYVRPTTSVIVGAELGGVALAAATSMVANKPFVIARNRKKDYGTSNLFEGTLVKDDEALIVEDIATTGGQVLEVAQAIRGHGATVQRIVAVLDRLEGARAHIEAAGFEFASLFTIDDLLAAQSS